VVWGEVEQDADGCGGAALFEEEDGGKKLCLFEL
jgi:hypothetical protein